MISCKICHFLSDVDFSASKRPLLEALFAQEALVRFLQGAYDPLVVSFMHYVFATITDRSFSILEFCRLRYPPLPNNLFSPGSPAHTVTSYLVHSLTCRARYRSETNLSVTPRQHDRFVFRSPFGKRPKTFHTLYHLAHQKLEVWGVWTDT